MSYLKVTSVEMMMELRHWNFMSNSIAYQEDSSFPLPRVWFSVKICYTAPIMLIFNSIHSKQTGRGSDVPYLRPFRLASRHSTRVSPCILILSTLDAISIIYFTRKRLQNSFESIESCHHNFLPEMGKEALKPKVEYISRGCRISNTRLGTANRCLLLLSQPAPIITFAKDEDMVTT